MKESYPVILTPGESGYLVHVPDFEINTEGHTVEEALALSKEAIGRAGSSMEEDGQAVPCPTKIENIASSVSDFELLTLVTVDFDEYHGKKERLEEQVQEKKAAVCQAQSTALNEEYILYQDRLKRIYWYIFGMAWLYGLSVILVEFTVFFFTVHIPAGIVCSVGCFFFGRWVVKKQKACSREWKEIKRYRKEHVLSYDIFGDTVYCFLIPFEMQVALEMLKNALQQVGEVESVDPLRGIVNGTISISTKKRRNVDFYVEKGDKSCKVRAYFSKKANDDWWDLFLRALFAAYPDIDFGVKTANGKPGVVGVLDLQGDTKQVAFSTTKASASLGGFLIGNALFGTAGAIVGGLSGTEHTATDVRTVYSDELLVRIIYSNGRLWEGAVNKGSPLFNEIMVNMV